MKQQLATEWSAHRLNSLSSFSKSSSFSSISSLGRNTSSTPAPPAAAVLSPAADAEVLPADEDLPPRLLLLPDTVTEDTAADVCCCCSSYNTYIAITYSIYTLPSYINIDIDGSRLAIGFQRVCIVQSPAVPLHHWIEKHGIELTG